MSTALYTLPIPQPFHAPFFQDHPGEPVPEHCWTLWCTGRLTEADTLTIQLGATPSGLTSAHLHHHPQFFTGRMPFLPPSQQCQSTEGNTVHTNIQKSLEHTRNCQMKTLGHKHCQVTSSRPSICICICICTDRFIVCHVAFKHFCS